MFKRGFNMVDLVMAEEHSRNTKSQGSKSRSGKGSRRKGILLHFLGTLLIPLAAALLLAGVLIVFRGVRSPGRSYDASAFGISTVKSSVDFDHDGTDDYADFLLGAQKDAKNHPRYDSRYLKSGWPPDNIGVCADVVWRSFREAGYDLRAMVDKDIADRRSVYTTITSPDSSIDFRRVRNLKVFFEKYAQSLTLDKTCIAQWQPGDIVIFGDNRHVGIVSDKRNAEGVCWIIHNGGQKQRDEDYLSRTSMEITGHYRFDASRVPADMLIQWKGAK